MINKQNLWFITLFSLIIVLSIYYLTMPDEALLTINTTQDEETTIEVEEDDILTALKVENDEEVSEQMATYQEILLDEQATIEEKNDAYEALKELNQNQGLEETIQQAILDNHKLKSFVKIKSDQVQVVISNNDHSTQLANQIIRTVQENFDTRMYITVKFQG